MIKRIFPDRFIELLEQNPAAVLLDPRQAGKNTLANQIEKE